MILNYTTKIAATKTIAEIVGILSKKGGRRVVTDYAADGTPTGISWEVESEDFGRLAYGLPVKVDAVFQKLSADGVMRTDSGARHKQAERTSWRIIKDWVEAQMACLESGQVRFEEVFLPYMLNAHEETLYAQIAASKFGGYAMLTDGAHAAQ